MATTAGSTVAVIRLNARLTRRSTIAVVLAVAAFMVFEVLAFNTTYPDEASRQMLLVWARDPGVRIIAGPGSGVSTVGGFAVWDAGLYLILGLAAWTLTVTTRVLRADETAGRTDLLLVGPMSANRVLFAQIAVLLGTCLLVGVAIAASLAVLGADIGGSLLYGAMSFGYCASLVSLAALASQAFAHRRAALGAAALTFGGMFIARMIGNSAPARDWLVWLSPAGWLDRSQAFGDARWWVVVAPVMFTGACLIVTAALRARRDAGAGILTARSSQRSMRWGLGSSSAFALRVGLGVLTGWAAGLVVVAAVIGALLPTMEDMLASDPGFLDVLAVVGVSADDIGRSFLSMWGAILGAILALYAAFRLGAARDEESSGRIDLLLARPLARWRWITAQIVVIALGAVVLTTFSAAAIFLAAHAAGSPLSAVDPWTAMTNALPAAAVFGGLGVLVFGVAPRLTVPLTAGAVVVAYVLQLVGPALSWPDWVLWLSPFHHLSRAPVEPIAWGASIVLVAIAAAFAVIGLVTFRRRDVVTA